MTPHLAKHDLAQDGRADAELAGRSCLRTPGRTHEAKASDLSDIVIGEFSVAIRSATRTTMNGPTPGVHIAGVVGMSAGIQMQRIAARRVVAGMQPQLTSGQRASDFAFQNNLMGFTSATEPVVDLAVAFPIDGCSPRPTLVRATTVDMRPDSYFDRAYATLGIHQGNLLVSAPGGANTPGHCCVNYTAWVVA